MSARRRLALASVAVLALGLLALALSARRVARRALPQTAGVLRAPGLQGRVEILRDAYGVPHIFAGSDHDAHFALGYVHAQDRLFQMEVLRHLSQGRLAELFGARALRADRLFRTVDLRGPARRGVARGSADGRAALAAYGSGVRAAVAALGGRLPPEFALLRHALEPIRDDDFLGVLGYMTWGLNLSWHFDPLFERLRARLGPERALLLFPWNFGGEPSVHAPAAAGRLQDGADRPAAPPAGVAEAEAARALLRLALAPEEESLLALAPALRASNNWALAPARSASGHALLANDPHLPHGIPGIWYEAHLVSPTLDVAGATLPGLPGVVLGRNRDVAWGFTNAMLDAADFFVEKLEPASPERVMHLGRFVPVRAREEILRVAGGADELLRVRETPHGPLVSDLLASAADARESESTAPTRAPADAPPLAYQWSYPLAEDAADLDGVLRLNRAHDLASFRAAVSLFGAVAQNVVYADRQGHIAMQTSGRIPLLRGDPDGSGFRRGWDGSQEWDGFQPFEQNPFTLDPPEGLLSSANNPTLPPGAPYYISSQWEPADRITRIREVLAAKPRLSLSDLQALHADTTLVSARELVPLVVRAWDAAPVRQQRAAQALELLRAWDFDMRRDAAAPALFAAFYKRLFHELFEDELGAELCRDYRRRANVSAIMMRAALLGGAGAFLDDRRTPETEDRAAILMRAFLAGVADLYQQLGGEPAGWTWGRVHTLTLRHPLGRASRLLAAYFDRGPFPVPGHNATVNKMEYDDTGFGVLAGPSIRLLFDLGDADATLSVLPAGQSGLPASPHYDDMLPLWLAGRAHPLPLGRAAVERLATQRLLLEP